MQELLILLSECCPMVDFNNQKNHGSGKVIDSMDMVNIISAIEDKYGITIEFKMINADNFDSADSILNMINNLKNGVSE